MNVHGTNDACDFQVVFRPKTNDREKKKIANSVIVVIVIVVVVVVDVTYK